MARREYATRSYQRIAIDEMDEGVDYPIDRPEPEPALAGVRLAVLMGPCPEEPEIVLPLDYLAASGAQVDVIAPDWTAHDWLPASRFWAPTIKIPYQRKISHASVDDYRGLILVGGAWNPAVVRTDEKMLAFVRDSAQRGLTIFSICHAAQILISAGLLTGTALKVTGPPDIRVDLRNAGADVIEDRAVVFDALRGPHGPGGRIVSCRDPNGLGELCRAIGESFVSRAKGITT